MRYETIADIYSAHNKIRGNFLDVTSGVAQDEAAILPEGEKWSIGHVVEHVSVVEAGMVRICARLIEKSRTSGSLSDGSVKLSPDFVASAASLFDKKLTAPEIVEPSGTVAIADSMNSLETTTAEIARMRTDLETLDLTAHTFRHPYFGELSAVEWLIVRNGHEQRHTRQIENLLNKIRN